MLPARRSLLVVPAVAAAVIVSGCNLEDDGPQTLQTRDVAEFSRIENGASVDLELRIGERQNVRVVAGEKVIDDVATEVRDGTLHVDFDHDGWGGSDVVVEASVPELTAVELSGSGDLDATGIDADAFDVRSTGSADISLAGTAGRLEVDLEGSGDADLEDLAAGAARVVVDGSGDATVRAADRLDVEVDGSGDVRYHGDPAVIEHLDGSGELSRAG
jgi:hypothetical protein